MSQVESLQTRFGRRITMLFMLCALGPVLVIAVIGYFQVRGQLLDQAQLQLEQASKNVGMGLIDQLMRARQAIERDDRVPSTWRLDLSGGDPATVSLVRRLSDGTEQRTVVPQDFLFYGASERAFAGPREATFCLTDSGTGRRIFCPGAATEPGPRARWDVFLQREYGVPAWTVDLSVPRSAVLQPIGTFRQTFLASIALVLGLVLLLSSRQVRRSMQPLVQLRRGTERVAAGDYSSTVEISSGDEFEDLAVSFNKMTTEVGGLIERLDQLSYGALQALARTIDASSPWTAGHSERVTALSLCIARRAGFSPEEMDAIRRGALLHDIGKIGIEPRIIDKAGPLTTDEMDKIKQHPGLGVRILAPLEAFRDALSIVESHHEKLDGTGYPNGLRGDAIPVLARLVAVADVYDALVSPRPYRPGWPQPEAIALIRASTGSHLDPQFVTHFLAVMDSEGDAARFQLTHAA